MGWSSSIHVRSDAFDDVARIVKGVVEGQCFLGGSGQGWIGVYSQRCEASSGEDTPKLSMALSEHSEGYVLAVYQGEGGFMFWLFHRGDLVDRHPLGRMKSSAPAAREIFKLASTDQARRQIEAALVSRKVRRPHEALGLTPEKFMAKVQEDVARSQSMSIEEKKQMSEFYSLLRSSPAKKLAGLCAALGIDSYDLNYSDIVKSSELAQQLSLTHLP